MRERWTTAARWVERWDLLRVRNPDEDVRRRGRVLLVLAASFGLLALVLAPVSLLVPRGTVYATAFVVLSTVYLLVVALTRRGRVDLAVTVMLLSYAAALVLGVLATGAVSTAPIFTLALVTLAGTLMRPVHVLPAFAGALVLMWGLPLVVGGRTVPVTWSEQVFVVLVVSLLTVVAALTSSTAIVKALAGAREQRDRAEHLAGQLRRANEQLEARVAERTAQLRELASRDALTGLHNRRHVDSALPALAAAASADEPLAVLAVDIDDFKSVNDRFGHVGGDLVLAAVAQVLAAGCRSQDVCGRVGGEEFVLLLPGTGLGEAVGTADLLRRRVSEIEWDAPLDALRLTVSVGVASATSGLAGQDVWQVADDRLFAAKRGGKDRVVARDAAPVPVQGQVARARTTTPAQASDHSTEVNVPMMNRSDVPGARSSG